MRKLLVMTALCMLGALAFAPAVLAQDEFDCDDFATQEDAQAVYNEDTSDLDCGMPSRAESSPKPTHTTTSTAWRWCWVASNPSRGERR